MTLLEQIKEATVEEKREIFKELNDCMQPTVEEMKTSNEENARIELTRYTIILSSIGITPKMIEGEIMGKLNEFAEANNLTEFVGNVDKYLAGIMSEKNYGQLIEKMIINYKR